MVAGGRSGQEGNDHRKTCIGLAHPSGVPDRSPTGSRSGTPLGCGTSSTPFPGGRRPQKPSATSGYPLATLRVNGAYIRPKTRFPSLLRRGG